MEAISRTDLGIQRRADLAKPYVGIHRRDARHRRRCVAWRGAGAHRRAAPARHVPARSHRRAHHVRRYLLRGDVRRLHHIDPPQHARRVRHYRHCAGRKLDGETRSRRSGARHFGDRLVRGRNACRDCAHAARAADRRHSVEVRSVGVLRRHGARLYHGVRRYSVLLPRAGSQVSSLDSSLD